ncbi:MAG: hypothetical protein IPG48_01930 [Saprospiraceae bacterium]|nr:hypothetical protein [Saprospiraceae bacterium]MBK6664928.1 hypothetical protein [Saprospiraceae bacterium]MBK7699396.1 hypothetical protein [Saprospiraceae bacterium]MBK8826582.1 hypothetical protein [Saprospiraceae bacterium]
MQNFSKDIKISQLKDFLENNRYVDIQNQPLVCQSFGLPYMPSIFQSVYRKRAFEHLQDKITTCAVVAKETGLPQKYLTWVKRNLEKKGLLYVVRIGTCPLSLRRNVQFITTMPRDNE